MFGWGRLPYILLLMMQSKAHLDILVLDSALPFWDEQRNAWLCFFTPSEARKKKYLYFYQVWQCSIIKTILIESSLPRITEDPWTDFPTHAARTSGLYHTVWWLFLSFEPHQLHKSHRKAPALCFPGVILWTCLPWNKKLPNWWRGLPNWTPDASLLRPGQPGQADGIALLPGLPAGGSVSMWY